MSRAALLAEHSGEDGSEDINDAGSTAAVHSQTDLAKVCLSVLAVSSMFCLDLEAKSFCC